MIYLIPLSDIVRTGSAGQEVTVLVECGSQEEWLANSECASIEAPCTSGNGVLPSQARP